MTGTRDRVARQVRRDPGIHFNELTRVLDLAPGQVQYHLRRLEDADDVVEESLYGRTHYYTPEYGAWERGALAVLRRETARDIIVYLMTSGPSTPDVVADGVGIARSTLEWHLDHLVEQSIVDKERDERGHVTLVLSQPQETAEMLRVVEPSVADRLVDRFTRLVDGLLAGEQGPTETDS
jgi:predicted transcriptional regulator